jgi:hypothetical protein
MPRSKRPRTVLQTPLTRQPSRSRKPARPETENIVESIHACVCDLCSGRQQLTDAHPLSAYGSAGTQPAGGIVKNRGDGSRPPTPTQGAWPATQSRSHAPCNIIWLYGKRGTQPGTPSLCPCLKKSRGPGQPVRRGLGEGGCPANTPLNNPQSYNPNGTQTRHQPGNPPKFTRSQFENHQRCQFGI